MAQVVNFKVSAPPALLAAPAIAFENRFAQALVRL
jgi:hypothetical protein